MKKNIDDAVEIPGNISCEYNKGILKCKNNSTELERKLFHPQIEIKIDGGKIKLSCIKGNKTLYKTIKSFIAHILNMFAGLNKKFVYELESVNIHFPMAIKKEGNKISI